MRCLSLIILALVLATGLNAQSPHGDLKGKDCSNCHNPQNWKIDVKKLDFDHSKTKFPLQGQHSSVDCKACHTTLKFEGTPQNCVSCHTTVHGNTLSNDCQSCHTPANWLVKSILPLHERSRFPLFGKHQTADCGMCHKNYEVRQFEPVQTDCYSCHSKDYYATLAPNHPNGKFSTDCTTCHDTRATNWRSSNVNHSFFPLTGGHSRPSCYDCHTQGTFAGLSKECYSCHRPNYEATRNPNHVAGNFSKQCQVCHNINAWSPAQFDHNLTTFPLTGKHTTVTCASCHTQGYAGTPKTCVSCHQSNYNATQNPNHTAAQFPNTCENCHTTAGWTPAQFDHDGPYFPIYSGKHRGKWNNCGDCHTNSSSYKQFSCTNCHEHNQASMNSEHQGVQGYKWESAACYSCHPRGTSEGAFNHQTSPFPLTGAHITTDCARCHTSGYANTPNQCFSCHEQGFNQTTKLNHSLAGFSHNCTDCHNTTAWASTTYNHTTATGFPLQNNHAGKTCIQCHQTTYTATTNECSTCHTPDYQSATNPNHVAKSYPQVCSNCHTDIGWAPATFDHSIVGYQLTGKHTTATCAQCHTSGYSNTSTLCNSCHAADYQGAVNPNHVAPHFPRTCEDCHTSVAWKPSTYNHDVQFFPIYSGKHKNKWNNDCLSCHTNAANFGTFSCIDCHEHNQTSMNQEHQGVANYSWNSQRCYDCHPRGSSLAPQKIDHAFYPVSGKHKNVSCEDCHAGQNSEPQCLTCHQEEVTIAHKSSPANRKCWNCHTTFSFKAGNGVPRKLERID